MNDQNRSQDDVEPEFTPLPKRLHSCIHQDEIGAIRAWRRLQPVLLSVVASISVGVAVHSCTVARSAGALETDLGHIKTTITTNEGRIEQLRAVDTQIERAASDTQSRVLVQLGRLEAQLEGISERLGRVEDQVTMNSSGRDRR